MSTALKCCHNAGISIFDITPWKLLMFITRRKNWHNTVGIRYHKVVEHDSIWGDSLLEEAGLCWHGSGACVSSLSEVKKVQLVLLYPCCRKWASQNLSFSVDLVIFDNRTVQQISNLANRSSVWELLYKRNVFYSFICLISILTFEMTGSIFVRLFLPHSTCCNCSSTEFEHGAHSPSQHWFWLYQT